MPLVPGASHFEIKSQHVKIRSDESIGNCQILDELNQAGDETLRSIDEILFGRRKHSVGQESSPLLCQFKGRL